MRLAPACLPSSHCRGLAIIAIVVLAASSLPTGRAAGQDDAPGSVLAGGAAFGDWTADAPGIRRRITPADLPPPYATRSATDPSGIVPRLGEILPKAPPGFAVSRFLGGLKQPRLLRTAPNGDVFIAESGGNRLRVMRAADGADAAATSHIFADGLHRPFGIAFYPPGPDPRYVYVAAENQVVRYPYRNGDLAARGAPEVIVPALPEGGHWTRDVQFSPDGRRMYVAVGSASNDAESSTAAEARRANILEFGPDGSGFRIFASGLRNPVSIQFHPQTGDLWASVNERDGLGDNLPPDYITRAAEGGFYGWPWYYIGAHEDPRHQGAHPDLAGRVLVPDVLLQAHSAPLQFTFYTGGQFPAEYRNDIFLALHGSWNRSRRTGYKLVRVMLREGRATGVYEDFVTGFITPQGAVRGRPVGVAVAHDGALLLSDDASGTVWRIAYRGGPP